MFSICTHCLLHEFGLPVLNLAFAACDLLLELHCLRSLLPQVAGLDVGWGQKLDLQLDPRTQRYTLERELPVGKFGYKFIFDDRWTYSADHPTLDDGGNINNYVEVVGNMSNPKINAARDRLLSEDGLLESEERGAIIKWLHACDSI